MRAKYIFNIILSITLVCSVLAPSIAPYVDCPSETISFLDSNDEENNIETEKKYDEKLLSFENYLSKSNFFFAINKSLEKSYLLRHQKIDPEVLLRPPRSFWVSN